MYIRLIFTCHVFSVNSILKPRIKSMRMNISWASIYLSCKTVSNLRECIFQDFDILANITENGFRKKKPDIGYQYLFIEMKIWNININWQILAHLSRRLKQAFLIKICPLSVVVFVGVVVNFLHFYLLLQNHWANFNQTWHKASLGEGDSSLFKWRTISFS